MSEERISWFPVPTEDQLPDNLRKLFNKAKEKIGFTPNVFRVYSFRPERLSAWFAHYKQLHEPTENRCQVSGVRCQVSGSGFQVSGLTQQQYQLTEE